MLYNVSFQALRPVPAWPGHDAGALHDTALLDLADPAQDAAVLLIGPDTVGLLCELLRRGFLSASTVRWADRPQAGTAEVALVVPCIDDAAVAAVAVAQARRALAPSGRVALRLAPDPSGALLQATQRTLLLHGFSAIQLRRHGGQTLLRADLAARNRLARA